MEHSASTQRYYLLLDRQGGPIDKHDDLPEVCTRGGHASYQDGRNKD
jgi:hypothetical protein